MDLRAYYSISRTDDSRMPLPNKVFTFELDSGVARCLLGRTVVKTDIEQLRDKGNSVLTDSGIRTPDKSSPYFFVRDGSSKLTSLLDICSFKDKRIIIMPHDLKTLRETPAHFDIRYPGYGAKTEQEIDILESLFHAYLQHFLA